MRWPDHGDDVDDAVTFVLDAADRFGVDPDRVAVMGHSAGGHLAAITTVDPDYARDRVDCLVSVDSVGYNLRSKAGPKGEKSLVTNAFGDDPAVLDDTSPTVVLRRTSGPVADAVVVTRGTPARQRTSGEFADAMQAAGAEVTTVAATGYSHEGVNDVIGTDDPVVARPVEDFLQCCLG